MTVTTLQNFAMYLAHQAQHNMQTQMHHLCHELGHAVKLQAESSIGTYQPGIGNFAAWAPLKQTTLDRKARNKPPLGRGGPDTPLFATGKFSQSIDISVDKRLLAVHIGTNVPEIVWTELGTARMAPRAVFGPAALRVAPKFLNRIGNGVANSFCGITNFNVYSWPQAGPGQNTVI